MSNYRLLGIVILIAVLVAAFWWSSAQNKADESQQQAATENQQTNSEMLDDQNDVAITTANQTYGVDFKGYFAKPEAAGSYPGVIMVHEWWGLNDHIKDMARQLAKEGYAVMAVDLYNGKVAITPEEAQKYVAEVTTEGAVANMRAATKFLRDQGSTKVAGLGWCFGGGKALALALSGEPLDATVIYYGTPLITDQKQLAAIKWPVLGIFGDKDQAIPVATVNEFDKALDTLGIQNSINIYPGVEHAFANPSGMNYAPNETKDAWEKTLSFLRNNLKDEPQPISWKGFLMSFVE